MPRPDYPPFLPPDPKPPFEWLIRSLTRPLLRLGWDIRDVVVPPDDLRRLAALRDQRALVLSNHPSLAEPGVMYDVLRQAGLRCRLLTAWDTLFKAGWFSARFFQWLGGYSIRRGRPDRAAMETTRNLLVEGERILAFPEGQTYGLNDTLIPFQEGLILIAFHAMAAMREKGIDAPVYLAPVALKYRYLQPMEAAIDASLARLEATLTMGPPPAERYARLRRVAEAYLAWLEEEEEIPVAPEPPLDVRIIWYRSTVVERLAKLWDAKLPRGGSFPDQVLTLGNAYEDWCERQTAEGKQVPTAETDPDHRAWRRLKTFLAFRDEYVAEWPSAERYAHVLSRLELDLWGKVQLKGPQRVEVRVGEIIDLREYAEAYAANKRETLTAVTCRLELEVRTHLESLWREAPVIDR